MKQKPIPWYQVQRGKRYELQSVTSQTEALQDRIGEPFVRQIEDEYFQVTALQRLMFNAARADKHPFTVCSRFATVEPATAENPEHVKIRFCQNYIVLREVP
jgi:hypothetical protein